MPKLTIDGREIEAAQGENLIQAGRRANTEIPSFCYHEKLSVAANCRMCLVEIDKSPKLQPACQMVAAEGMVVHTKSKKVLDAQKAVLEFLLLNHPLDCPICDKAGECMLQDNYVAYDHESSRQLEAKTQKPRLEVLGPLVNYNAERCIMCTRCIRFMAEVAEAPQLGCFNRGDRSVIGTFPGQPLDNPYSLNVVELCPVGALGNLDFRFHSRVWQLEKTETVCAGCAKGCNTEVHSKKGVVYRMIPRQNDEVNSTWMCDEGRLSYHSTNEGRATVAMKKGVPTALPVVTSEARALLADGALSQGDGWVVFVSPTLTVEDAYAWLSTLKAALPKAACFLSGKANGVGDELLRRADKNPNRAGVTLVAEALGVSLGTWTDGVKKAAGGKVLVLGTELPDASLVKALARAQDSLVLGAHANDTFQAAALALPAATHFESDGSFVNDEGRVQRVRPIPTPPKDLSQLFAWAVELWRDSPTLEARWPNAESVFAEVSQRVAGFAGQRLAALGTKGKPLAASKSTSDTVAGSAP